MHETKQITTLIIFFLKKQLNAYGKTKKINN